MCFSFNRFFSFLAIFQFLGCLFLIFKVFQCFLTCSRSHSFLSHFPRFQFSRHNPGPSLYIYHFSLFSVFLVIFQVIKCLCLISMFFQFCRHNTGPTVCISHISHLSLFFTIIQVLQCVSYFARFTVFLAICHVIQRELLISLVCELSRHISGPTM